MDLDTLSHVRLRSLPLGVVRVHGSEGLPVRWGLPPPVPLRTVASLSGEPSLLFGFSGRGTAIQLESEREKERERETDRCFTVHSSPA